MFPPEGSCWNVGYLHGRYIFLGESLIAAYINEETRDFKFSKNLDFKFSSDHNNSLLLQIDFRLVPNSCLQFALCSTVGTLA